MIPSIAASCCGWLPTPPAPDPCPHPNAVATAHNPACGDRVRVELALRWRAGCAPPSPMTSQACVLTQASAALLAGTAPGQDRAGIAAMAAAVRAMLQGAGSAPAGYDVFEAVAEHAGRHVCVLLPFEAALEALEGAKPGSAGPQGQPTS